jgi:hypothetical protein
MAAYRRSSLGEVAIERDQHVVDDPPDQPLGMIRRNAVLEINIREQATRPLVQTAHPGLLRCQDSESFSLARVS